MPIDTSIYGGLLGPQRNALDYANEYARSDATRNQNALQALQLQQAASVQQQRNALRAAVQSGKLDLNDPTASANALTMAPDVAPALFKTLQDQRTSAAVAQKDAAQAGNFKAETEKTSFGTQVAKANKAISDISALASPQDALQSIQQHLASGDIDQTKAQGLMATLQPVLQGQMPFGQWQRQMVIGIMDAKERIAATAPKVQMVNTGAAEVPMNVNADAGQIGPMGAAVKKTVSPDTVYTQTQENNRAAQTRQATVTKPFEVTGPDGMPMLVQQDREGNVKPVPGFGPKSGASKPLTNDQANARLFATRMQEADAQLANYAKDGVERPGNIHSMADAVGLGAVSNVTQSPEQQGVEQAQRNFVNAVLRKESGAAISNSEFESARKQYFPRIGDSDEVKAQKAQNRKTAIEGMLAQVPVGQRPTGKAAAASPGGWKVEEVK